MRYFVLAAMVLTLLFFIPLQGWSATEMEQPAPDHDQVQNMVVQTMDAFWQALHERDLAPFRETMSRQAQLQSSVFQLNLEFTYLMQHVEQGTDWKNIEPEMEWPPLIVEDDHLLVRGDYLLPGEIVLFSLAFILEDGEWKIDGMEVESHTPDPVWEGLLNEGMSLRLENPELAIVPLQRALFLAFEKSPLEISMRIQSLTQLGMTYAMLEKHDRVLPLYQRALVLSEDYYGAAHSKVTEMLYALMSLYMLEGKWDEGLKYDAWAKVIDSALEGDEEAMQRLSTDPDILHLRSMAAQADLEREFESMRISDE